MLLRQPVNVDTSSWATVEFLPTKFSAPEHPVGTDATGDIRTARCKCGGSDWPPAIFGLDRSEAAQSGLVCKPKPFVVHFLIVRWHRKVRALIVVVHQECEVEGRGSAQRALDQRHRSETSRRRAEVKWSPIR
jgi:hypothetical protein